ncbi:MAG: dihydroneopterin aldolase [Chitinophagaceae bacterium]
MLSVQLNDLSFHAFHGIYGGEARVGNEYLVDLTVKYDESKVKLDSLSEVINYEELYDIIKKRMAISSPLLEEVAEAIVRKIRHQYSNAREVIISIYKINPAIENFQGKVGITLEKKFDD